MGRLLACCLLASLLAPAAGAQEPDRGARQMPSGPDVATLHGRLGLSIKDALEMGLRNNLDVEVARHDPPIAWEDSRIAWGAYDPESFAEYGYESTKTPVASSLQASASLVERNQAGQSGIRGLVPWLNTSYQVGYEANRLSTNSSIRELSPEYRSTIAATLTQPLLRDLIWSESWTRIKTSRIGYDVSLEDFTQRVMDTVRQIEQGYWNVVASEEALRVTEKSLETATALLEQTKIQYEVGVVSRVEVVQAEAGVAQREFERIDANRIYRNTQDRFLQLILGRNLAPESRLEVELLDRPQDYVVYEIDVGEAARKAFSNRPELAAQRKRIETQAIQLKFARNQRLPRLDIVGRIGFQGLAGRSNPNPPLFDPTPCPGGAAALPSGRCPVLGLGRTLGDADDLWGDDTQSASIKGIFSIPIGNIAGRHGVTRADIELRRAKTQLRRLEENIIVAVRTSARNLESAQEGIEAAERSRIAAAEQLRAERIRLEQGESTPFDVLQREEVLVEAEVDKIRAVRGYRNSIVDLDREQGTILQDRNIVVDRVRPLR